MTIQENCGAVTMMLRLAKFTDKPGLKAAAYKAAGLHLERLRHGRPKVEWVDLVETLCGISERRAYELMAIGKRIEALELQRAATAARGRKHYAKKSKGSAKAQASNRQRVSDLAAQKAETNQ